jgi:O-antigen ligase
MNLLVILLFISVFATEFLAKQLKLIHPYFILVPEVLSAIAVLVIVCYLMAGKRWTLDWRYGLFFALYIFVIAFGFLVQDVPSGAVVAGMRSYLKFIPFFLLPAIYPFTARQLKTQLIVLLTILAVQSPLAVYQRFVQFAHKMHTGDPIVGMTTASGVLTTLMMCAVVVVVALYLRRKLSFPVMLAAVAVFCLPATINETKVTVVMLPIAVLLPAFFMPRGSRSLRRLVPIAVVGSVAGLAFVSVYDRLIANRADGHTIESFLFERGVDTYLYTGAADGENVYIGRLDSIAMAFERLSKDPLALSFGLGAGNVSESFLPAFHGKYAAYYKRFGLDVTQVTSFLWEIGVVGVAAYLLFYFIVWQDARFLARRNEESAALGQVWATVVVIMGLALFYNNIFSINETGYLFWFYSGVVAASAGMLRRTTRRQRERQPQRTAPSWAQPISRAAPTYR